MNNKTKIPIIVVPIAIIVIAFASMSAIPPDTSIGQPSDPSFSVNMEELSDITVTGIVSHWQPIDGPAFAITPENNLTIPMADGRIYLYGDLNSNLDGKQVTVTGKLIENYEEYQMSKHGAVPGGSPSTSVIFVTEVKVIEFIDEHDANYTDERLEQIAIEFVTSHSKLKSEIIQDSIESEVRFSDLELPPVYRVSVTFDSYSLDFESQMPSSMCAFDPENHDTECNDAFEAQITTHTVHTVVESGVVVDAVLDDRLDLLNGESISNVVHGFINADTPNVTFENVTIYVQLVDASLQDVSSILLGEIILEDVNYNSNLRYAGILYSIPVDFEVNEYALYYVSAHADIDGDGQTSKGDWISMTAHPVLSRGSGNESSIILSLVE